MSEERCVMCGEIVPEGTMVCKRCEDIEPSFDKLKVKVILNKVEDIPKLVALASKCSGDVVVRSGRFAVDAKSIMGLYSLDLSKPVDVEFYGDIPFETKEGMKDIIVE